MSAEIRVYTPSLTNDAPVRTFLPPELQAEALTARPLSRLEIVLNAPTADVRGLTDLLDWQEAEEMASQLMEVAIDAARKAAYIKGARLIAQGIQGSHQMGVYYQKTVLRDVMVALHFDEQQIECVPEFDPSV